MGWLDAAGLVGVLLVLAAYAGAQFDALPPRGAPALTMNLVGSGLILTSMLRTFNLPAFAMEAAWAMLALIGLGRLALRRLSRSPDERIRSRSSGGGTPPAR